MNASLVKEIALKTLKPISVLLLGFVAFYLVIGMAPLDPKNIAWLSNGDPAQHFLGWHFFRNSEWGFPIGVNPRYGLDLSAGIVFSDSVPLFAFIFKILSPFLPEIFQYSGLWLLSCFVLQSYFSWKLVGLISDNTWIRFFSAGIFIFSPPMMSRLIPGHLSLLAHFLIIWSLYFVFRPEIKMRRIGWMAILICGALIHAYLFAMILALWLADLTSKYIKREINASHTLIEFLGFLAILSFVCWQSGYFSIVGGTTTGGFGIWRMNMLSVFDSNGWSYVIKDIPEADGFYPDSNYFGLGVILLIIMTIPAFLSDRAFIWRMLSKYPIFVIVMIALTWFALSNRIGFGSFIFEYPLPDWFTKAASVFRASNRMFYPVFYTLIFLIIALTVRNLNTKSAVLVLLTALIIQVVDTSAGWINIRDRLNTESNSAHPSIFANPIWKDASQKYRKIRWITPDNHTTYWRDISTYAAFNNLSTDAVYLARIGPNELNLAREKANNIIRNGSYEQDTIYLLDEVSFAKAHLGKDINKHLLAKIDGFNVIFPNWKKCLNCPKIDSEVKSLKAFPSIPKNIELSATPGGEIIPYLSYGWSHSEDWGVWSDGNEAEIVVPVHDLVKEIHLKGKAFAPNGKSQRVLIEINDISLSTLNLSNLEFNSIIITIPLDLSKKISEPGVLRLKLYFPNAFSPSDAGLSGDERKLGYGLQSILFK
ncbi:DUF6311 domain-containing protein [Pseudomonas chlororaphis]|uniref:DUF6311 domain-containing protein n=1 Tax=Pseudomonas chlororaphis TaxID=587753 RepID=UPI0023653EB1|nr:DUF6311 domain-containing protein [Pseudomonas chlororaphis]WDH24904.1 DUF6311 domain-containing protein [Pseudomonas chlororaphis]